MKKYILLLLCSASYFGFAQKTYTLSEESTLTIDGTSTVHDWTVVANTMECSIKVEDNLLKEIDLQVKVADIRSERGATMDKKMHEALQKEAHPNIIFTLKHVKNASILVGTLTVAGRQKEVEIDGKIDISGNGLQISGEYDIALKDFEIEPPTAMFGQVIVGDEVIVKFNLVLKHTLPE